VLEIGARIRCAPGVWDANARPPAPFRGPKGGCLYNYIYIYIYKTSTFNFAKSSTTLPNTLPVDEWNGSTVKTFATVTSVDGRGTRTIMADERLTDLFRMTMELAARSGSEQKLKALGKALASGVLANDDAAYEQSLLLMRTIGQLEAPDIRVLSLVQHFERVHPTAAKDEDVWAGLSAGPFPPLAVWVHLEQTGLIRKVPGSGEDQPYYLTDYGKQVVEELVTAGQAD